MEPLDLESYPLTHIYIEPISPEKVFPDIHSDEVKCKDCGAFGHTARSLRCPMKRWQGALVPLPLGSRFASDLASITSHIHNWHPNMPLLIHTSKRKSVQDPDHSRGSPTWKDDVKSSLPAVPLIGKNLVQASKGCIEAPGKRWAQSPTDPTLTCVNPPKKPRLSPVQTPQQSTPTADLGAFLNLPPPPSTAGCGPRMAFGASRETPAQGQRFDLQPPADRSPSKSVRGVPAAHPPPISIFVRAQPLRMRFLRDAEGCWSCRYTVPPSLGLTERPAPPAQSPSVDQAPEGLAVPGPRSVLYDDLLVSSSSKESDWDADTSGN
ncbi:hypothetical protein JEQ12_013110 [Ovis aries]|uniref:Zinc knuckle domain-containing protein n=1 Tax=Ovis aries TaxID=9940 RepID=A0A835ZRX7_SHEEP|nr:hypothetical protein JEQ12_013110 [Ovis aries]